jgi:predicted 3-demethylubiquinone-9 3-methyltransferase (glyoxalase superfamily)
VQAIIPNLWFDDQAEEAVRFYTSLFPNSETGRVARFNEEVAQVAGRPPGSVMTIEFTINGQEFLALNGGPIFKFTEAVSFIIPCETQEEIDRYWSALTANGGEEGQCGWLKDRWGLSWQIAPSNMNELVSGDAASATRVMHAMLPMKKIDKAALERAYAG